MDRHVCPYESGFDACDPLGSVLEWSGQGEARAARVLRRRCRSEGVERSPFEDALGEYREPTHRHYRAVPKSHFTLNNGHDRYHHECLLPAAENGDYLMAYEQRSYQMSKSKNNRLSPKRPLIVPGMTNPKEKGRLPKVEELLEKVDQEMIEAKQPLKSILNNPPTPKSPPQSILKKPKNKYQDQKFGLEGRRRQRAASESDHFYSGYNLGNPINGYDSRLTYLSSTTKRAKDNSGSGYSYGSAVAMSSPPARSSPTAKSPVVYRARCSCREPPLPREEMHLLRTTAINDTAPEDNVVEMPSFDLAPACPVVSPALPVSSATATPAPVQKKCVKKKVRKVKSGRKSKDDCSLAECDDNSRSNSPDPDPSWHMETDALLAEIDKLDKALAPQTPVKDVKEDKEDEVNSVSKLTNKLTNGAVVSIKKKDERQPKNKEQIFMTALHTINPFKTIPIRKESLQSLPEGISSVLRASLFPRVPPYLKFLGPEETPARIPPAIQKHLKWKLTTITPIVVKKTLLNSGFRLVKSECDTAECPQEETVEWIGIWGKHMKSLMFRAIKDGQKMNHFPGTFQIGRKDRLWRNLQKLSSKYGLKEFGIMPKSYVLPHDLKLLKHDWDKYAADDERWIIKPPASARGTGIKVVSRWTQIPKKRPVVVQRYVHRPLLINGSKFDLRLYLLLASVHPLRLYLYRDGLARFASVKYSSELSSLGDRYMHLTNYSINRLSKNYTPNEDAAACEGHKWTLQSLFQYLKTEKKIDTDALWESLTDLVIKTIISGEASISSLTKANVTSRYNCYELFGIDVLLDEDLKPWLLEVNISPSLHSASPLDVHVKGPLVTTCLNLAQFQVPAKTSLESLTKDKPHKLSGLPYDSRLYTVYLSKEERDKHIIYTNMEERDMYLRDILATLTPDDARHLLQAEDELTQASHMQRIFPTQHTHRYLGYLSGARYYNRLFDAWETRYHADRAAGIELLRNLCDIGYHLEVPPVPLKNDVDAPSPPASEASQPSLAELRCGDGVPGSVPAAPVA